MKAGLLLPFVAFSALAIPGAVIPAEADPGDGGKANDGPVVLERKLHGAWKGPPCGGDWTFNADGGFVVEGYSPGGNRLSGTWELRWDALPPTLLLTVKTSDAPERIEIGEKWELKLIELNDETLGYVRPQNPERSFYWKRVKAVEGS